MLRWLWKTKGRCRSTRGPASWKRIRPCLEGLEARDCPSGLQITAFNAMVMQGHTIMLAGMVSDANPASVNIRFSGVASGSVNANSLGQFQLLTQASALGTVFALGFEGAGQWSDTAQTNVSVPPPTITSFTVATPGPNRAVTVMGQVAAGSAAGLTVTLSGIVTGTAVTGSTGSFTFSGTAASLGQVNGRVTDVWGQTGYATAQLTNIAPTITNFAAVNTGFQNIWTFEGRVTDEWAPGETVTLSGIPALQNVRITVGNDGWFFYQAQLTAADTGLVVATVTDWWGATGQAQVFVS